MEDLTDHHMDSAGLWVFLYSCDSCQTLHFGVAGRLELEDTGGVVVTLNFLTGGGVVQAAIHRLIILDPCDSRFREPSSCYTLKFYLLALFHCHVTLRDVDISPRWETEVE